MSAKDRTTFGHAVRCGMPVMPVFDDPARRVDLDTFYQMLKWYLNRDSNPRLMRVLEMRFVEEKTLEECGREFGVGKERARQLESKALRAARRFVYESKCMGWRQML